MRSRRIDSEGFVLPMLAVVLVALMGAAAFGVDLGAWYLRSAQLQRAADAAALGGVVHYPNRGLMDRYAQDTLRANKIDLSAVQFTSSVPSVGKRYRVELYDPNVSQYFSRMVLPDGVRITRSATAEIDPPVKIGSPRNFVGGGDVVSASGQTSLWAAIDGKCSSPEQGDRYNAMRYHDFPPEPGPGLRTLDTCYRPGTGDIGYNPDYTADGYSYVLESPVSTTLWAYDPAHHAFGAANTRMQVGASIETHYFTPLRSDHPYLNSVPDRHYVRNRHNGVSNVTMTTRYRVYGPVAYVTAIDDNSLPPLACDVSFGTEPESQFQQFRSICPNLVGNYLIKVDTPGADNDQTSGVNAYSLIAQAGNPASGISICDSRTDSFCTKLYGRNALSFFFSYVSSVPNTSAEFYLTELGQEYARRTLYIDFWDPDQGSNNTELIAPNGCVIVFDYSAPATPGRGTASFNPTAHPPKSGSTGKLTYSSTEFNGRSVTAQIDLDNLKCTDGSVYTDYAAVTGGPEGGWWKVRMTGGSIAFGSPTKYVTSDRSVWQVRLSGGPVHLITER